MTAIPDGTWDFDDLDETERRLLTLLDDHPGGPARAEVLTQLARVEGLRGNFERGEELVQEAETTAGADVAARTRVLLERGRLLRSSGDPAAALPLFAEAFDVARYGAEGFLAGDAAHMAALAAPDDATFVAWTERGIEYAAANADGSRAGYWLGPLLNNLGWQRYEAGRYEEALDAFERALGARERDPSKLREIEIARYALGKALRALGRPAEAALLLERAVARTAAADQPDGWFHEELAEDYAAVGRTKDAAEQAAIALPLLEADDPSFAEDGERATRLRHLAQA